MSILAYETKGENNYYVYKVKANQQINSREIDLLSRNVLTGLAPVQAFNEGKNIVLRYCITNFIPFESYSKLLCGKKQFIEIVLNTVTLFRKMNESYLSVRNLVMDKNLILFSVHNKAISFIYLPIINSDKAVDIRLFFENLAYDFVFNNREDCSYVKEYIDYFKKSVTFSIYHFESFMKSLQEKCTDDVKNEEDKVCLKCGKPILSSVNFCGSCGAPIASKTILTISEYGVKAKETAPLAVPQTTIPPGFIEEAAIKKAETQGAGGTTVLGQDEEYSTTVLSQEELELPKYPYLIRKKTGEKIILNKPIFRIGKEKSYVDYYVSNNGAISRSHAEFITKDGKYYVQDKNSTNKTFVDDKAIPPDVEFLIKANQRIRLANEEFEFHVDQ